MNMIAYSSPFIPAEWIAAHGLRPSRLRPSRPPARIAQGQCPFARAFVEEVESLAPKAAVFATTCDQMRRASETVTRGAGAGKAGGVPVFLMNVPATWQTPAANRMYSQELRRLGQFLCEIGGTSPSNEHLAEVMLECQDRRDDLMARAPAMSAKQLQEALGLLTDGRSWQFAIRNPQSVVQLRGQAPFPEKNPEKEPVPLAILGGPLTSAGLDLLDLIEQAGGRVVLDATETGLRGLPAPLDRRAVRDDPMAELAAMYFGGIGDAFRRPNSLLYEWLGRQIAAARPRGIVLVHPVWCDLWHAELHRLRQWSSLPVLHLVDDGSPSAFASASTRVHSFMEMLR